MPTLGGAGSQILRLPRALGGCQALSLTVRHAHRTQYYYVVRLDYSLNKGPRGFGLWKPACTVVQEPHVRPTGRRRRRACCGPSGCKPRGQIARASSTVRGAKQGHGARPGYDCRGSPPWLLAGVMYGLPRWHTQRSGRCPNSRYLYGQRRVLPLSSTTCPARKNVTEHNPSCAIALRSPASERSPDLSRYG